MKTKACLEALNPKHQESNDLWYIQDIHFGYTHEQQQRNRQLGKLLLGSSMPVKL